MNEQQPEALRLDRLFMAAQDKELRRLRARVLELEGQQKREPLTPGQIGDAYAEACKRLGPYALLIDLYPEFARAIERAHGIE